MLSTQITNAQDIFKQHGFNKKPLTLSNGHYNEFFNNDEVVQIGTVLLNTQTNQIIAFVNEDTAKTRYLSQLPSRWMSPDPLAAKYPQISPYVYCTNNPIKYIDPNGKDWVLNNETKKYTWMDNVTSSKQAPKGYTYVGANNESLLTSMGVKSSYEQNQTRRFLTLGSEEGKAKRGAGKATVATLIPAAKGALLGQKAEGNINITPNVSYNQKDASDNNKSGITFQGVTVSGTLSQEKDEVTATGGTLNVKNGNNTYTATLGIPEGSSVRATGTTVTTASVAIPANQIIPGSLTNANISAGTTNNEIIYIAPVSIDVNLQQTNSTTSENE